MRFARLSFATVLMVLGSVSAAAAAADPDDVRDYAQKCYARLGITNDDLTTGPFKGLINCKDGTRLFVTEAGVKKDIGEPAAAANFPASCDRPMWLSLASHRCYGNTWITKLTGFKNKNVVGALFCRHKNTWSDGDKTFDDIAMILTNESNGETCWFQSPEQNLDGTKVHPPHQAKPNGGFDWRKPSETAKTNCIRCHDNGPFMNSRIMHDSGIGLSDGMGKYVNGGAVFSTKWKPPVFVSIARAGKPDGPCTGCHKIHTAERTKTNSPDDGDDGKKDKNKYRTCDRWINFTTGKQFPTDVNATGKKFGIAFWMPDGHGEADAEAWNKEYGAHVAKLVTCCKAKGKGVRDCGRYDPASNTVASALPGVRMYASTDGGTTFPYTSVAPSPGIVQTVAAGTGMAVGWEADDTFTSCGIEATFPAGVRTFPADVPDGIGTASTWTLEDVHTAPDGVHRMLDMGVATEPGEYRFDIYCTPNARTSVTFVIDGQPKSVLAIQALVNEAAGPIAASDSGAGHVSSPVQPSDEVDVAWSADNVVDGSCSMVETRMPPDEATGVTSSDAYGFLPVALVPDSHQTYTLSCVGADGPTRTVSLTVDVAPPRTCSFDADDDGTPELVIHDTDGDGFCEFPDSKTHLPGTLRFRADAPVEFHDKSVVEADSIVIEPGASLLAESATARKLTLWAVAGDLVNEGSLDLDVADDLLLKARGSLALGGEPQLHAGDRVKLEAVDGGVQLSTPELDLNDFTVLGANRVQIRANGFDGSVALTRVRIGSGRIDVLTKASLSEVGTKEIRLDEQSVLTTDPTRTNLPASGQIVLDSTGRVVVTGEAEIDAGYRVTVRTRRPEDDVCLSGGVTLEAGFPDDGSGKIKLGGVEGRVFDDGSTAFVGLLSTNGIVPGLCP